MTITLHDSVRAARNDGPDPRIAAILTRIAADVADLRSLLRLTAPAGLTVDAVVDGRLTAIGLLVDGMRGLPTHGQPLDNDDEDEPFPTLMRLTADDLTAVDHGGFVRGYDAGWAAAGGDGDLEVETP